MADLYHINYPTGPVSELRIRVNVYRIRTGYGSDPKVKPAPDSDPTLNKNLDSD